MPVTTMNRRERTPGGSTRGRSNSPYRLGERREKAFDRFAKGWTIKEVAEYLNVHVKTASRYKQEYEDRIEEIARANPGMLSEVLQNTIRALEELDTVRATAWREYEAKDTVDCEECGAALSIHRVSPQTRNQFLKTVLTAQEQRHKIYGLFGVKQEFFLMVQQVKQLQDALLEFMQRELCQADREKLDRFLANALGAGTASQLAALPVVSAELIEGVAV